MNNFKEYAIEQKHWSALLPMAFLMLSFLRITVFQSVGIVITYLMFFLVAALILLKNRLRLSVEDWHIVFLFHLPFWFFFSTASFPSVFIHADYIDFFPQTFGRMANVTIYLLFFLFTIDIKNRDNISTNKLFRAYIIGCYILLFFGIWQILSMMFNVPFLNISTRTHIHSMDKSALPQFLNMRVTSIAEEPAYLIPFLIDAIIILFYTSKKYFSIALFAICLLFTLSLSGYANFFLIAIVMCFFIKNTKTGLAIKTSSSIIGSFAVGSIGTIVSAVIARFKWSELIESGRLQEMIIPLNYMIFDAPLYNQIFGFGPKGMGYLSTFLTYTTGWNAGGLIAVTSHFIFIDLFVEHGIIGLAAIVLLFYYLYLLSAKVYKITKTRLAQILWLNLLITSLYTSDYASPRFTIIILFLLCLYKDAKKACSKITQLRSPDPR